MHARNALEHCEDPIEIVEVRRDPLIINMTLKGVITHRSMFYPTWCYAADVVDRGISYRPPSSKEDEYSRPTISHLARLAIPKAQALLEEAEELVYGA